MKRLTWSFDSWPVWLQVFAFVGLILAALVLGKASLVYARIAGVLLIGVGTGVVYLFLISTLVNLRIWRDTLIVGCLVGFSAVVSNIIWPNFAAAQILWISACLAPVAYRVWALKRQSD